MSLLYQKRRLKVNKIKRQIQAVRNLFQRIRVLLSFVMIALIIYSSVMILKLPQFYLDCNKLYQADSTVLKIQGNVITPDYKIIDMVRQTQFPDTQIFKLDTTELQKNILQLQPIKKVYVRRYCFPARLVIVVEERTPAFLLAPNLETEPVLALSTDGVLIDRDYLPFKPVIKAKKLLTYGVRNGVDEVWDKKRVEEILKLIKAIETYSGQEVQYIDLRNEKDAYIMLEKYLIRFGEINDTALKRAELIASVLTGAAQYGNRLKYIDLRWEESSFLKVEGPKEKETKEENLQNSEEEITQNQETQIQDNAEPIEEQKPLKEHRAAKITDKQENKTQKNNANKTQEPNEKKETTGASEVPE